ncbi:MAG: hypothetical protein P9E24_14260 [Candidatus Competibacter sp.]|nr:hypothetical protein [Candidatus Competibacter sp.]MDG4582479.1 hypothetical protein [Candidatus Competibacter sp.]
MYGWSESGGDFLLIVFRVIGWVDDGDTILKPDAPHQLGQALEAPGLRQLFSAVSANWNTKPSKVLNWTLRLTPAWNGARVGTASLRVRPLPGRGDQARRLSGIGRDWLPAGADLIEDLIRERMAED